MGLDQVKNADFQRGRGCFQCMGTGYKGRTGVFEVLVIDDMVNDMILEKRSAYEITRKAKEEGKLTTLIDNAMDKVVKGITTFEEVSSMIMS